MAKYLLTAFAFAAVATAINPWFGLMEHAAISDFSLDQVIEAQSQNLKELRPGGGIPAPKPPQKPAPSVEIAPAPEPTITSAEASTDDSGSKEHPETEKPKTTKKPQTTPHNQPTTTPGQATRTPSMPTSRIDPFTTPATTSSAGCDRYVTINHYESHCFIGPWSATCGNTTEIPHDATPTDCGASNFCENYLTMIMVFTANRGGHEKGVYLNCGLSRGETYVPACGTFWTSEADIYLRHVCDSNPRGRAVLFSTPVQPKDKQAPLECNQDYNYWTVVGQELGDKCLYTQIDVNLFVACTEDELPLNRAQENSKLVYSLMRQNTCPAGMTCHDAIAQIPSDQRLLANKRLEFAPSFPRSKLHSEESGGKGAKMQASESSSEEGSHTTRYIRHRRRQPGVNIRFGSRNSRKRPHLPGKIRIPLRYTRRPRDSSEGKVTPRPKNPFAGKNLYGYTRRPGFTFPKFTLPTGFTFPRKFTFPGKFTLPPGFPFFSKFTRRHTYGHTYYKPRTTTHITTKTTTTPKTTTTSTTSATTTPITTTTTPTTPTIPETTEVPITTATTPTTCRYASISAYTTTCYSGPWSPTCQDATSLPAEVTPTTCTQSEFSGTLVTKILLYAANQGDYERGVYLSCDVGPTDKTYVQACDYEWTSEADIYLRHACQADGEPTLFSATLQPNDPEAHVECEKDYNYWTVVGKDTGDKCLYTQVDVQVWVTCPDTEPPLNDANAQSNRAYSVMTGQCPGTTCDSVTDHGHG